MKAAFAITALMSAFGVGWTVNGWRMDAMLAAAQQAQIEAAKALSRTEAARLAAQASADAAALALEDQAHADTDASGGLSRARVDRLRQR